MPTKNRTPFLVDAVRALLAQTTPPDELIIVDQSDDDLGVRRIAALVAAAPAPRRPMLVHVLDRTINGAAAARNAGFDRASGDIVVCCDDDVLAEPSVLERLLAHYRLAPEVAALAPVITNYPPPRAPRPARRPEEAQIASWGFLFQKHLPRTLATRAAFAWYVVGVFMSALVNAVQERTLDPLRSAMAGVRSVWTDYAGSSFLERISSPETVGVPSPVPGSLPPAPCSLAASLAACSSCRFNTSSLAVVGLSLKAKVASRRMASVRLMGCGGVGAPAPVTVVCCRLFTLTGGPSGAPVAGSSGVMSTKPSSTVRRVTGPAGVFVSSVTIVVPRIAVIAFGVLTSMRSPTFIRSLITASLSVPSVISTVETPGTSVMRSADCSRIVTVALRASRSWALDCWPVVTRSRTKTLSLTLSGEPSGVAVRATAAVPSTRLTSPAGDCAAKGATMPSVRRASAIAEPASRVSSVMKAS